MKVHNVRLGFANNSSSLHSIIMTNEKYGDYNLDDYFGWQHFVIQSQDTKKKYLKGLLDNEGVDHQSVIRFPYNYKGTKKDTQFITDFKKFIMQDNITIIGGNDNTEFKHPLYYGNTEVTLDIQKDYPAFQENKQYVVKNNGNHYSLFDRATGKKTRVSFPDENGVYPDVSYSTTPELVDISITDYCSFNCAYCYRGSTTKGVHADTRLLLALAKKLGELQVWEVALGGGEPTEHPDFEKVLKAFKKNRVIPNFTTKSLSWPVEWLEHIGSFAYSANSVADIKKMLKKYGNEKATVHIVLGTCTEKELERRLAFCDQECIRVTLLGYKTDFRGSDFKPIPYDNWLDIALQYPYSIGVDTPIAKQFQTKLVEAGISDLMYHTTEGDFSCFIDAVKKTVSASSYGDRPKYDLDLNNLQEVYQKCRF